MSLRAEGRSSASFAAPARGQHGAPRTWLAELQAVLPKLAGTLGTSGAGAALGLVTGTIAARALGPSQRGDLAQILLWPQLIITLGNMGIELAAVYLSGDPARRRNVPATLLVVSLVQAAVLLPLFFAVMPLLLARHALMKEALMMAPLIPLYLVGAVAIDVLAGRLRFGAFNLVRITLPVLYCAGLIALALSGRLSPLSAALTFLCAHAAGDFLALFLVWRGYGLGRFDRGIAKDALHFGLRAHLGRLSPQALGIDMAIIALMLASSDLGLYVAAAAFLAAPSLVAASIGMVVFPQASAAHQAGEKQELRAAFALQVAAVLSLSAVMFVFAHPLLTLLFGHQYAGATAAMRLLAVGAVAVYIRQFPMDVLRGVGRPGLTSVAEAANWVIFLAIVPLGGYLGGLVGIAAAVAIAGYLSLAVLTVLAWRSRAFHPAAAPAEAVAVAL
jgi:O-antigen/teichoic acid export membrane protein